MNETTANRAGQTTNRYPADVACVATNSESTTMETNIRNAKTFLSAALVGLLLNLLSFAIPASAQNATWSAWQSCGDNVSVSFSQVVGTTTWTWKFRNDGTQTITYMDFNYTDNTGQNYDVFPGSLQPGQAFGGWGSFTANSAPTIQLKTVQFATSSGVTSNGGSSAQQNNNSTSNPTGQQSGLSAPPQNSQSTPPLSARQQQLLQSAQQHVANAQADLDAGAAFQTELSDYGKWMTLNGASYWQPNEAVADSNWRPYCTGGHWVATDLGLAWQSDYDWGWAAFHYGRWANDPVLGWIWQPGSVWAPAWVAWRNNDMYCGWAPLPPGTEYAMNLGFMFNGVAVSMDFGFGLGADDYCFISVSDMCAPSYTSCLVAHDRVAAVYQETAIVKKSYIVRDGRIANNGISLDRIRKATGRDIQPIKVSLGSERIAQKSPIDGRLAMRQINFAGSTKPRVSPNRATANDSVINDLLNTDNVRSSANQAPRKAEDVLDDLLVSKKDAPKAASEKVHSSDDIMDRLLSSDHSAERGKESHNSDDVVGRLIARGHDGAPRPPVQQRPAVTQQYGATEAVSRPPYQQPAREQVYQPPTQNYRAPQQNYQQQENHQQYQAPQENQQQYNYQMEQQRQQQAEQERQQQEQQREQERQQQQEQQREQERQKQQEQQRKQERQKQQEQQREQERQRQQEQRRLQEQEQQKKTYPY